MTYKFWGSQTQEFKERTNYREDSHKKGHDKDAQQYHYSKGRSPLLSSLLEGLSKSLVERLADDLGFWGHIFMFCDLFFLIQKIQSNFLNFP